MNILLININPVVSRIVSLCVQEENINLEEYESVSSVEGDRYDIVFIDEAVYTDEAREVLSTFLIQKKVFLSSKNENEEILNFFDFFIKKPFLPSNIYNIFRSVDKSMEAETKEHFIFPLASEDNSAEDSDEVLDNGVNEESVEHKKTDVLDVQEIEKIKVLLEMDETEVFDEEEISLDYEMRKVELIKQQLEADGLEIVSEEEYVEELGNKQKEKRKKQKTITFEKALITSLKGMKVKKIKKLLKGAKVTIKINFKDKK